MATAMMASTLATVSTPHQHGISDLLLLGCKCCIKRLGCSDRFMKLRCALGHALLTLLHAFDCAHLARIGPGAGAPLRATLLEALVHGGGVLAQDVGEAFPL